jgi:fructoselysine-6-P-deglycase FrlB-like protein
MSNTTMAREIAAQAEVLPQCVREIAEQVRKIPRPAGRIFAGGCGDSAFAPGTLGGVFAALNVDVNAATSMALSGFTRFKANDTVVLSSISGGTKRTVEAAHVARTAGAEVVAITCGTESALAHAATHTIVLPFTPISRKTPHTLDYTVTLLALAQLALWWSGEDPNVVLPQLAEVSAMIDVAGVEAEVLADAIDPNGKIFLLGAGPDLSSAEYGAAKFHEAGGQIAIEAETENFIHGMNFMVEPCDSIVALGNSTAGLRRGRDIVGGFTGFVACAGIIGEDEGPEGIWTTEFRRLLQATFTLQRLCLAIADKTGLVVELPRAGRAFGQRHASIQSDIMRLD